MAWSDLARVKRFLAIAETDTADDAVITDSLNAAQHLALTLRAGSGYVDDPNNSPNAGATEGVTRWAALLYQARGTGEGFAGFIDTGAVIGTPYYESRRMILMLLGVPRPTIDGVPVDVPVTPPPAGLPPFYYAKAKDVADVPDTYTPVVSFTDEVAAGVYMFGISLSYTYPITSRSVYIRWRTTPGGAWTEFVNEPGDATDVVPLVYTFPAEWAGGTLAFEVEMRKELGGPGATLDVLYADVWAGRVA